MKYTQFPLVDYIETSKKEHGSKRDFDELHSFIEEQIDPPDLLTEP